MGHGAAVDEEPWRENGERMWSSRVLRRSRLAALFLGGLIGPACDQSHAATLKSAAAKEPTSVAAPLARPARGVDRVVTFQGACDASGAVEIDSKHFAVADDEDNVIRIYDADRGGPPLHTVDLSPNLQLTEPSGAESDFEGATRLGDTAYFVASHGRTAKGKLDPDRLLLVATTLPAIGEQVSVRGDPYRRLVDDLIAHPAFAQLGIAEAALRAPKEPGGLNLEGMTATPDGSLLMGFRSPVPAGRALLFRILNPRGVGADEPARLSDPILLDLKGLGVRALSTWGKSFLIAAGPSATGGQFRLFRFDGKSTVSPVRDVDFTGFGPEGFFTPEARDELLVLSDDGTRMIGGKQCKKLKSDSLKSFRGLWIKLPK